MTKRRNFTPRGATPNQKPAQPRKIETKPFRPTGATPNSTRPLADVKATTAIVAMAVIALGFLIATVSGLGWLIDYAHNYGA